MDSDRSRFRIGGSEESSAIKRLNAVLLLVALAGCSKSATGDNSAPAAASAGATTAVLSRSLPSGNACDRKPLTPADLSEILKGTITVGPLQGDPQSCVFTAGDYNVTVSLRPGLGDTTVNTVLSGGENVNATSISGVGDKAAWTSVLNEINATKNNLLCDIQSPGNGGATQQKLGALCNKIFASS